MIIRIFLTILLPLMGFTFVGHCQTDALTPVKEYYNHLFYDVETVHKVLSEGNKPQNIILMIGDGMGVAQIQAGMIANKGALYLNQFPCIGFAMTHSADSFITDSGAGGTAIASGVKTFRSAIGVGFDSLPVPNLSEQMKKTGKSVGVVVTSSVTHATPAAFVSHQLNRDWDEAIAMDFSVADIDLFIGGGYSYFSHRSDTVSLIQQLEDKGFQVVRDMEEMAMVQNGKLAALLADEHLPYRLDGRGDMLPVATQRR